MKTVRNVGRAAVWVLLCVATGASLLALLWPVATAVRAAFLDAGGPSPVDQVPELSDSLPVSEIPAARVARWWNNHVATLTTSSNGLHHVDPTTHQQDVTVPVGSPPVMRLPSLARGVEMAQALFPGLPEVQGSQGNAAQVATVDWQAFGQVAVIENLSKSAGKHRTGRLPAKSGGSPYESLDLASSTQYVADWLEASNPIESADSNGVYLDQGQPALGPNGIPDLAEFLMIQHILQDPDFDLSSTGGVTYADVAARWEVARNAFQLAPGVSSVDERILDVVAAYCTLSDPISLEMGIIISSMAGLEIIDTALMDTTLSAKLSAQGDADGDGFSNLIEWQEAATDDDFDVNLAAHLAAALDSDVTPTGTFYTMNRTWNGGGLYPYPIAEKYLADTEIELTAVPNSPWLFDHWEIKPTGTSGSPTTVTENPTTITMDADYDVEMVFVANPDAEIYFDDLNLEVAVRVAIGHLQGELHWGDFLNVGFTSLDASNLGIGSLEGLQYCLDLTELTLSNNNIVQIFQLTDLPQLISLDLSMNSVGDLRPVANMASLENLMLGRHDPWSVLFDTRPCNGRVQDLNPLAQLHYLLYLDLSCNEITDLSPLSESTNIVTLLLDGNPISDFSPLANLTTINTLGLSNTGLGNNDLAFLAGPNVTPATPLSPVALLLNDNAITSIEALSGCTQMDFLTLDNNTGLTSIGALSSMPVVSFLMFSGCPVSDLSPISGATYLRDLYANQTAIKDLDPLTGLVLGSNDGGVIFAQGNTFGDTGVPFQTVLCEQIPRIEDNGFDVYYDGVCPDLNPKTLTTIVSPSGHGYISPFTGSSDFAQGTQVTLTAYPTSFNWLFSEWTGDASGASPSITVTMNNTYTITAVFTASDWTLTMLSPEGGGQVVPSPGPVGYLDGDTATLQAQGSPGWAFYSWVDGNDVAIGYEANTSLLMTSNRTTKAVFHPADVTLDVAVDGGGSVLPSTGRHYYLLGDVVSLWAHPNGQTVIFDSWEGDLSDPCPWSWIAMDADKSITAVFSSVTHTEVPFPDAVLRQAVLSALGKSSAPIYLDELVGTGFTELDAANTGPNVGIQDLTGLDACRDLTSLNLAGNAATDLTPLATLGDLYSLDLSDTDFGANTGTMDLSPLAHLGSLGELHLTQSRAVDLGPLVRLHALHYLYLEENQITNLAPLAQLTQLNALKLDQNLIADITPLAGLTHLTYLTLSANLLSDLTPLSAMTQLQTLDVSANLLTAITGLSNLQNLTILYASDNQLANVSGLASLVQLQDLALNGNALADLDPLAGLTALRNLYLQNNQVVEITALVANSGLCHDAAANRDDVVNLTNNPLSHQARCEDVDTLVARGVQVVGADPCTYVLTIQVQGPGSVAPASGQAYERGSTVTLTATHDPGYGFSHWEGDASGASPQTNIPMNADKSVTAVFTLQHSLTASIDGSGSVAVSRPAGYATEPPIHITPPVYDIDANTHVQVDAQPDQGWRFSEFTGGLTGSVTPTTLTMTADMAFTAHFIQLHELTVTTTPLGSGTVVASSGGTELTPAGGPYTVVDDQVITLAPTPASADDWLFTGWGGTNGSAVDSNNHLTISGDMSVEAQFTHLYDLAVTVYPDGLNAQIEESPTGSPPGRYLDGTQVTITAEPVSGYDFWWAGDAYGSDYATTATMTADRAVIAHYAQIVTFPDEHLEQAVRNELHKPTGNLYLEDLQGMTALTACMMQIEDLTGLENCTNLRHLDLTMNNVTDLSPLSDLERLEVLQVGWNPVESLYPLSGVSSLKTLTLWGANLPDDTDLAYLTTLVNLESLTIAYNQNVLEIPPDLEALTHLKMLSLIGNGITSVDGLGGLTAIEELYLTDNAITDVTPLGYLDTLDTLYAGENQISIMYPLYALELLDALDLHSNQIDSIWYLGDWLINLTYLRLDHNLISDVYLLSYSYWLEYLQLNDNLLTDVSGLSGLQNLKFLQLDNNSIEDLDGLATVTAIHWLYLSNNDFEDLTELVQNTSGLAAGDYLMLDGNSLTDTAACGQIPALEARGVYVYYPPGCVTEDSDGDLFTNGQEHKYLSLFIPDPILLYDKYLEWIDDPLLHPPIPASEFGCVRTTFVNVLVLGQGSVNIGEGIHQVATYCLECADPCPSQGLPACDYNVIALTATPAQGWTFRRWFAQSIGEEITATLTLTLDTPYAPFAEFVFRPGIEDLDLVADLENALTSWSVATSVQEYDLNAMGPGENYTVENVPNGIPDAAEFYLIQSILKDIHFNLAPMRGASHDDVWSAWSTNLQQAQADLSSVDPEVEPNIESIERVIAAYMTIGDDGSVLHATRLAQDYYSVTLSVAKYNTSGRQLAPYEDVDMDAVTNLDEWNYAAQMTWDDALPAFADAAMGGAAVASSSPAPPQSDLCDGECLSTCEVTGHAGPEGAGTASVAPTGAEIRWGTMITAQASPGNGDWRFHHWMACGTVIDGSQDLYERFPLMDFVARCNKCAWIDALYTRAYAWVVSDCQQFTIHGSVPASALPGTNYRVYYLPPGKDLTLWVEQPPCVPRVYAWDVLEAPGGLSHRFNYGKKITMAPGGFVTVLQAVGDPQPDPDLVEVEVHANPEDGGRAYASCISSQQGPEGGLFRNGVTCPRGWSTVVFNAEPNAGYVFTGWADAANRRLGSSLSIRFPADPAMRPRGLTANFTQTDQCKLTLAVKGCGWLNCPERKKYFAKGDPITLEAIPAWCQCGHKCCSSFKQWVGNDSIEAHGRTNPNVPHSGDPMPISQVKDTVVSFTISEDTEITAEFSEAAKTGSPDVPVPVYGYAACHRNDPERDCITPIEDTCKNVFRLISEGSVQNPCTQDWGYILCYNSWEFAYCQYPSATNWIDYEMSGTAGHRFARIRFLNVYGTSHLDPIKQELVWDAYWGQYKYVELDCINCRVTRLEFLSPAPPEGFEDVGQQPCRCTRSEVFRALTLDDMCQVCLIPRE